MGDGNIITGWIPERDPHRLAALGKLGEEAGELSTRACRCIVQGLDERDPESGRTNREELCREIADVRACIELLCERKLLPGAGDGATNGRRMETKLAGYRHWHDLIGENATTPQATLAELERRNRELEVEVAGLRRSYWQERDRANALAARAAALGFPGATS